MSTKEYESAFPVPEARGADDRLHQPNYTGMSLRDYFAAAAITGMLSLADDRVWRSDSGETLQDWRKRMFMEDAVSAYTMADAMIDARNGGAK